MKLKGYEYSLSAKQEVAENASGNLDAKKQRTREEVYRLKKAISFIAKHYAGYDIDVLPLSKNDPEQTWKCTFDGSKNEYLKGELEKFFKSKEIDSLEHISDEDFKPQSIFYLEDDLEQKDESVVMGLLDHESWHSIYDNYKYGFENMRQAMDEGFLPSSMGLISNVLADGRITHLGVGESDIKRQRQLKLHEEYVESTKDWHKASITRQMALLTKLKMVKDFLGMMDERSFKKVKASLAPEVQEVFNNIQPSVEKYFGAQTAEEANRIFIEEIWDEYKALEQKAQDNKSMEDLFDQAQSGDQGGGSSPFDNLPPDIKQQIQEEIERQKNQAQNENQSGQGQGGETQMKSDGQESSSNTQSESTSESSNSGDISQNIREQIEKAVEKNPVDMSQVPDDLKEKMKEAINRMSDEDKAELAKKARELLDEEQTEQLNEDLPNAMQMEKDEDGEYKPKLNTGMSQDTEKAKQDIDEFDAKEQVDEKTKEDLKQKIDEAKRPDDIDDLLKNEDMPWQHQDEIEQKAKTKKEQLKKEREGKLRDMQNNGFMGREQIEPTREEEALFDEYRKLERSIKGDIIRFIRMLEKILPKKEDIGYGTQNRRSGSRLDTKALGRYDKRLQGKVIKSREITESNEARMMVGLLLDISTSMGGDKLQESLKTLLLFALGLEQFDIDLAIYLFDDKTEKLVQFGEQFSRKSRIKYKLMKMLTSVNGENVRYSGRGGTDMGTAVQEMNADLNKNKQQYPDYMSALFAISDGETFGQLQGDKLTNFINGWNEYQGEGVRPKHLAMGFFLRGLSSSASESAKAQTTPMEKYFGERGKGTVVVDNYSSLLSEAFTALRTSITKMTRKLHINMV